MRLPLLPPEARLRRDAATRLLERLLLAAILAVLLLGPRRGPPTDPLPAPLDVDLAADPFERLLLLPGVGPARAAALLEARARLGPPAGLDDLLRVEGITPTLLDALARSRLTRVLLAGRPLAGPENDAKPPR